MLQGAREEAELGMALGSHHASFSQLMTVGGWGKRAFFCSYAVLAPCLEQPELRWWNLKILVQSSFSYSPLRKLIAYPCTKVKAKLQMSVVIEQSLETLLEIFNRKYESKIWIISISVQPALSIRSIYHKAENKVADSSESWLNARLSWV